MLCTMGVAGQDPLGQRVQPRSATEFGVHFKKCFDLIEATADSGGMDLEPLGHLLDSGSPRRGRYALQVLMDKCLGDPAVVSGEFDSTRSVPGCLGRGKLGRVLNSKPVTTLIVSPEGDRLAVVDPDLLLWDEQRSLQPGSVA